MFVVCPSHEMFSHYDPCLVKLLTVRILGDWFRSSGMVIVDFILSLLFWLLVICLFIADCGSAPVLMVAPGAFVIGAVVPFISLVLSYFIRFHGFFFLLFFGSLRTLLSYLLLLVITGILIGLVWQS